MGVGFTTHDNFDFSVNIQRGDFVSLDVDNDGDWDHMGFVTNVDFMYEDGYFNFFQNRFVYMYIRKNK